MCTSRVHVMLTVVHHFSFTLVHTVWHIQRAESTRSLSLTNLFEVSNDSLVMNTMEGGAW